MASTVHVVARFQAKPGKEDALKSTLIALVPPSRRELGCYQYDLLHNPKDPLDFCFVERWESEASLDQHALTEHVRNTLAKVEDLVEVPPDIRRYRIV